MYKLPMSNLQDNTSSLPPGFRFHPTDEELIVYYLKNQAMSKPCPVSIIPEVDIYKFDPWQLPEKAEFGEKEWYFFTPRDRKYPNGVRPNRATVSGYWKATGTDKTIYSGSNNVGIKKALVFYKGRPPKGTKTDWIMHEYRLHDPSRPLLHQIKPHGSMRLDDWVLCRIYRKRHAARTPEMIIKPEEQTIIMEGIHHDQITTTPPMDHMFNATTETKINNVEATGYDQSSKFPRTFSLAHLCEFDYNLGSISNLFSSNANSTAPSSYDYQNQNQNNAGGTSGFDSVGSNQYLFADLVNKNNNPSSQASGLMNQQQLHSNPVYKFP